LFNDPVSISEVKVPSNETGKMVTMLSAPRLQEETVMIEIYLKIIFQHLDGQTE
jgi:hypothetical protein